MNSLLLYLPAKLCYFLSAGAKYTYLGYLIIFLTNNGLDVEQGGIIISVKNVSEFFGGIVLNILMDRYPKHTRKIIIIDTLLLAVVLTLMPFIPQFSGVDSDKTLFTLFLICSGLVGIFEGGLLPAIDAKVIALTKAVSESLFVNQRLFLFLGIGLLPFLTGLLNEKAKNTKASNYIMFIVTVASTLILSISCYFLYDRRRYGLVDKKKTVENDNQKTNCIVNDFVKQEEVIATEKSTQITKTISGKDQLKSIFNSLKNWEIIVTFLAYFFVGFGFLLQYSFVFELVKTELNASSLMMGLGALIQAFGEVAASRCGGILTKYFKNDFFSYSATYFTFAGGFLAYYYFNHIAYVFAINFIIGFGFGTFIMPASNVIFENTDDLSRGSIFAIALSLLNGIGGSVAGAIGGVLMKEYGGRKTFLIGSVFFLFLMLVYLCIYFIKRIKVRNVLKHQSKDDTVIENENVTTPL